jgi:hypothetical protein
LLRNQGGITASPSGIGDQKARNLIVKHPKCSAGIWFGVTGWAVWQTIVITIYHRVVIGRDLFLESLPVIAAVVIGAWLGGKIVCEATTRSRSFAVKRGMAVMFLSLLFYCLLISSLTAIMNWSVGYALAIFMEFMLVSWIGFGWLIALLGAIGGWFLYLASNGTRQRCDGASDRSLSGDD